MSVARPIWNLALAAGLLAGCGTTQGVRGPETNLTPTAIATKVVPLITQGPRPPEATPAAGTLPNFASTLANCAVIQATDSIPAGWFLKQEPIGSTDACYLTKDAVNFDGSYKTGMTIQRHKIPTGVNLREYALAQITKAQYGKSPIAGTDKEISTPFTVITGELRSTRGNILRRELGKAAIVDGQVYTAIFTSPITDWDQNYNNYGKKMFNDLTIKGHLIP